MTQLRAAGLVLTLGLLGVLCLQSAEHLGTTLDGQRYDAKVIPPSARKPVYCQVEFKGKTLIVYQVGEPARELQLKDEDVADVHNIDAVDAKTKAHWKVDVEDVDP